MIEIKYALLADDKVFQGVDVESVDNEDLQATLDENAEKYDPPRMSILPVSQEGEVVIEFDQDMIAPPNILPSFYRKIILFSIISTVDGSKVIGRNDQNPKKDAGRLLQEEDEYANSFEEDSEA